jgi:hypothetical protein
MRSEESAALASRRLARSFSYLPSGKSAASSSSIPAQADHHQAPVKNLAKAEGNIMLADSETSA